MLAHFRMFMFCPLMLIAVLALAATSATGSTIAKLAPYDNGDYSAIGDTMFTAGGRVFVGRMERGNRLTLRRVEPHGRTTKLSSVPIKEDQFGRTGWAGSDSIIAAVEFSTFDSAQGESYSSVLQLLAGPLEGSLVKLDRCPRGGIAVDGNRLAELSSGCDDGGKPLLKVFELRGKAFRRVSSTALPADALTGATDLALAGDFAMLTGPQHASVFQWKSGAVDRTVPLSDERVVATQLRANGEAVIAQSTTYGETTVRKFPASSTVASWISPNLLGNNFSKVEGKLIMWGNPHELSQNWFAVDAVSQSISTFGRTVVWPEVTPWSGAGMVLDARRVTWGAHTCYWDAIFVKPLNQPKTVTAKACTAAFVKGSARVRHRNLLVDVRSPRGFSRAITMATGCGSGLCTSVSSMPPGRHTLAFALSTKRARYLSRHRSIRVTFKIERALVPDVTYTGSLH